MMKKIYSPKANEILDVAERYMRLGGFDAVSFRDLATEVGVKSASVHYYFPQKTDLGQAVVERYTEKVMAFLGASDTQTKADALKKIKHLAKLYETALTDDAVCLCCMLGSEAKYLPEGVAVGVKGFFSAIRNWTETVLSIESATNSAPALASFTISSLQGAMTQTVATNDYSHFHKTVDLLVEMLKHHLSKAT